LLLAFTDGDAQAREMTVLIVDDHRTFGPFAGN
jgi:hypothetical protein